MLGQVYVDTTETVSLTYPLNINNVFEYVWPYDRFGWKYCWSWHLLLRGMYCWLDHTELERPPSVDTFFRAEVHVKSIMISKLRPHHFTLCAAISNGGTEMLKQVVFNKITGSDTLHNFTFTIDN